jgi:heat shock protein HtpX
MAPAATQSVLVYDRIFQNRVKTAVLVFMAIVSVLPFIGAISYAVSGAIVANFGPHRHMSKQQEQMIREALTQRERQPGELTYDYEREFQREMQNQLDTAARKREKEEAENLRFRYRSMAVISAALCVVLGLLFWALVASPTSQMLSMCGARPAGPSESEARRLLDNLSIGAGLPPPKLYVIDTPVPNAFAAGLRPENSVVVVTSGLLALLDHREVEGVLAHELSHIGNRDTRLNTVVASLTLFLRLPYLMRQRKKRARTAGYQWSTPNRNIRIRKTEIALLPIYIYVFFIAPFLATLIRAAISRSREFLADADAALITRYPEGLLRALAKIGGAGSTITGSNPVISHLYFASPSPGRARFFTGNLLATHPSIEQRITRLMEFNGGSVPTSVITDAIQVGKQFGKDHPPVPSMGLTEAVTSDELSVLTVGNPLGRVYRTLAATKMYDQPRLDSAVLGHIPAGALVVVFDDPGKFRQVLNHEQEFGYIPSSVKLKRIDALPAEVFDPVSRARLEAAQVAAPDVAGTTAPAAPRKTGLSGAQIAVAAGFFVVVFAGIFLALLTFGK